MRPFQTTTDLQLQPLLQQISAWLLALRRSQDRAGDHCQEFSRESAPHRTRENPRTPLGKTAGKSPRNTTGKSPALVSSLSPATGKELSDDPAIFD